jgi:hypothetical protein
MSTAVARILFVLPVAAIIVAAYAAALLIEWLGDVARNHPHSENVR